MATNPAIETATVIPAFFSASAKNVQRSATQDALEYSPTHADAIGLLNWLFEPDDLICVVRAFGKTGFTGTTMPVSRVATPEFMAETDSMNRLGADVYFAANPLLSVEPPAGGQSARCTANLATIRTIAMDVDKDSDAVFEMVQSLTPPGFVQASSNGKFQKFWKISCTLEQFNQIVEALVFIGGDEKCKDAVHLYRVPGFINNKPDYRENPPIVTPTMQNRHESTVEEFGRLLVYYATHKPQAATTDGKPRANDTLAWLKVAAGLGPADARVGPFELKKNGPCPFHESASADSSYDRCFAFFMTESGYPCFKCQHSSCELGGDIIDFVVAHDGIDVGTAIRKIKDETFANKHAAEEFERQFNSDLAESKPLPEDAPAAQSQPTEQSQPAEQLAKAVQPPVTVTPIIDGLGERYEYPVELLGGDKLSELARLLYEGTSIPPQFVHGDLAVYVGNLLDGKVSPPQSSYLRFSMREYHQKISPAPQGCKGEAWTRVLLGFSIGAAALGADFSNSMPKVVDGAAWGSGAVMCKELAAMPNCIANWDEGTALWSKGHIERDAIVQNLLTLYQETSIGSNSFKNGKHSAENVHLGTTSGFVNEGYVASFEGTGTGASGFQSRNRLSFGEKKNVDGVEWPVLDFDAIRELAKEILLITLNPPVVTVTPAAKELRREFKSWLGEQDQHYANRIDDFFERDALRRAVFSGGVQTVEVIQRSISYAKDLLRLRKRFWPTDAGNPQALLEGSIRAHFESYDDHHTDAQLQRALSIGSRNCKYSLEQYGRAVSALKVNGWLEPAGLTRKKKVIWRRVNHDD